MRVLCHSFQVALTLCLFLPAVFSWAIIIEVPNDYPTIQQAIDASAHGDEIIVSPGTYVENINFNGKNIVLRSSEPTSPTVVASTVIDGNQAGSVVTFSGTEATTCILSGFTITNGYGYNASGLRGLGTRATIQNNLVTDNHADDNDGAVYRCNGTIENNIISGNLGGGLCRCEGIFENNTISGNSGHYGGGFDNCTGIIQNNIVLNNSGSMGGGLADCDGIIQYNTISGNSASWGGGLYRCTATIQYNTISNNSCYSVCESTGGGLSQCQGIIQNNVISDNTATGDCVGYGGGLFFCVGFIENNLITGNVANSTFVYGVGYGQGGGLSDCSGTIQNNTIMSNSADDAALRNCNGTIRNCIIWGNAAPLGSQLYHCSTPSYCCIQNWTGGGIGNISDDPRLVDPDNGDFHLLITSPCVDAGGTVTLTQDFEGDPRPWHITDDPRGDGSDFDIGADEYTTKTTLTVCSEHDSPIPVVGINHITTGTLVNAYMTEPMVTDAETQYLCTGWLGQGSVPASGSTTSFTFVLDQPSTLTWLWQPHAYYLNATANPSYAGSVTLDDGVTEATGWHNAEAEITVIAIPQPNYAFDYWSGDLSGSNNPESLTMDSPRSIIANFSPVPTPTPIPTPTPTGTSTPLPTPIKEYDFETGPQAWSFHTVSPTKLHISHWDDASSVLLSSAIGINSPFDESSNYFALWDSLDAKTIPYSDNSLYQANWLFSTNRQTTNAVPSLRFRIGLNNQKAFSYSRVYTGEWLDLPPSPDSTTYTLFFEPPISADGLFLAFSLIDWTDDFRLSQPAGEVYLEEVSVYRHELAFFTGWTLIASISGSDFDSWVNCGAPPFIIPEYYRYPDRLSITSGIHSSLVFGCWSSPTNLLTVEPSNVYRLTSNVSSSPHLGGPDLRLRVHTDDYRYAWYTYYVSSYTPGESALPPETGSDYPLYLTLPYPAQSCHFSFDLIDFSSTFGGTLNLHSLSLDSHPQ